MGNSDRDASYTNPKDRTIQAVALVIAVLVTLLAAAECLARCAGARVQDEETGVPEEDGPGAAEGGYHAAALKHIQRINSKYVAGTSRLLEATNSTNSSRKAAEDTSSKDDKPRRSGSAKEQHNSGARESNSGDLQSHKNGSVAPGASSPRLGGVGVIASPSRVKNVAVGGGIPDDGGGKVRRSAGVIGGADPGSKTAPGPGVDPSAPNGIPRRRTDHETNSLTPGHGGMGEEAGGFAVPEGFESGHMASDGGRFPLFARMEGSPYLGGGGGVGPHGGGRQLLAVFAAAYLRAHRVVPRRACDGGVGRAGWGGGGRCARGRRKRLRLPLPCTS